ncbi:uncharacterized protein LOC117895077 isoform X1 [Drosophila subobscura]|uniref:uncharacterized protein LOC117895077 isoform X1 n=1 Tax=Drosophila subobscura TaxID=7241 RepID=UPI00155A71CB|nr:uncharacterized protein LOC117895077 isoform X1 [Drosophila subobscura]
MFLNLVSKVLFTGAQQKIQKINFNETNDNQKHRALNAKVTTRSINSNLRNGLKNCHIVKKSPPLDTVQVVPKIESRLSDGIIKLTKPTTIQMGEAIQTAKLTGKRILISEKDLSTDDGKLPLTFVAQSQYKTNKSRFLVSFWTKKFLKPHLNKQKFVQERTNAQKPKIDYDVHVFTAETQELMLRSVSADDVRKIKRSLDVPELSVMRVRSESRVISIREMDIDESDCESLTESVDSINDMSAFKPIDNMQLELISPVKYLTASVKPLELNPPQTALLCYMINFAHLVFAIACLRGIF